MAAKNPARYHAGHVECIDAMESAAAGWSQDPSAGLLVAQVIRYLWRLPRSADPLRDLDCAVDYLRRLRARLDGRPGTWDRADGEGPR